MLIPVLRWATGKSALVLRLSVKFGAKLNCNLMLETVTPLPNTTTEMITDVTPE